MLRGNFLKKKFKPRLVPDAPKSFPKAIHPEELPETPAERLVRLETVVSVKGRVSKGKADKKGAPKGEQKQQTRRDKKKSFDTDVLSDDRHLALGEDLDSTDEEGKFRDDIDDNKDDLLDGAEHEKLLESEQKQQDSPPVVSVEIQIEPPLDELPIDEHGALDHEGLLTEDGVLGADDHSKDKKSKKEKKKKDKTKPEEGVEDEASKDVSADAEAKDEAERGKEKRKRSIFARSESCSRKFLMAIGSSSVTDFRIGNV